MECFLLKILLIPGLTSDFVVVESADKTNDCEIDAYVLSEAECKKVPDKRTDLTWGDTIDDTSFKDPIGCYRFSNGNRVYYNKATRGNSRNRHFPICGNCKINIMKRQVAQFIKTDAAEAYHYFLISL